MNNSEIQPRSVTIDTNPEAESEMAQGTAAIEETGVETTEQATPTDAQPAQDAQPEPEAEQPATTNQRLIQRGNNLLAAIKEMGGAITGEWQAVRDALTVEIEKLNKANS